MLRFQVRLCRKTRIRLLGKLDELHTRLVLFLCEILR